MRKYRALIAILDRIRAESDNTSYQDIYLPDHSHGEAITQARSRSLLHLYLMVNFGILDFTEREAVITDGRHDGGIDAYHIDSERGLIYFIQSKFRATEKNFNSKLATANELLAMDITRLLNGETVNEQGTSYNSAILGMQLRIASISDIGRYRYKVLIIANPPNITAMKLKQLTGGYPTDTLASERIFRDLVLPVIAGTYFRQKDIQIAIDLSNKNAGSKISYEVRTKHYDCEITVVFVPIVEIARIMHRYKNSILQFNPRSYLELAGHVVNDAIRETVLKKDTNEFALFNNGITILSDETYINERIGQRNKAQLTLRNPQIINGGQTAYTLSRILEEVPTLGSESPFDGKEVLLKVITLIADSSEVDAVQHRINLIDEISTATNRQTPVITADKYSNNKDHLEIQNVFFDRFGILYERKRGEFADGLHKGYVTSDDVLERNLLFRLHFAVVGNFEWAVRKRLFAKVERPLETIQDIELLDRLYFAFLCYQRIAKNPSYRPQMSRDQTFYMKLHALSLHAPGDVEQYSDAVGRAVSLLDADWTDFRVVAEYERPEFWQGKIDKRTGKEVRHFNRHEWVQSGKFSDDARRLFGSEETRLEASKLKKNEQCSGISEGRTG
jgi:hypothetical protein